MELLPAGEAAAETIPESAVYACEHGDTAAMAARLDSACEGRATIGIGWLAGGRHTHAHTGRRLAAGGTHGRGRGVLILAHTRC